MTNRESPRLMNDTNHKNAPARNKGGRPRKGTLEYRRNVWQARL